MTADPDPQHWNNVWTLNFETGKVAYRNNTPELTSELIVVYVRNRSVGKPPVSGILLRGPLQETRQATEVFHCFYILNSG
jgi:hypothetical protein